MYKYIFIYTPQKSNIDTKNCHFLRVSTLPFPNQGSGHAEVLHMVGGGAVGCGCLPWGFRVGGGVVVVI